VKALIALCFTALICSCAATPAVPEKKEPKRLAQAGVKEYRAVDAAVKSGDTKKAIPRLKRFIANNPDTEEAARAQFELAQIYQNQNQDEEALANYLAVASMPVSSTFESDSALRAAKIQLRLGRTPEAEKTLSALRTPNDLPIDKRAEFHRLRHEIMTAKKNHLAALESLAILSDIHPDSAERERQRSRLVDAVDARFTEDELLEIAKSNKFLSAQAPARFRYGLLQAEKRDYEKAREYFAGVIEASPGTELAERARNLIAQIDSRYQVDSRTIGVVLPLTGKQAGIGYKALRGIQLGLGVYGGEKPSGFRLAVIDSEGNPDTARRAIERLVQEDNVIAVIGGLLSKTAPAEAAKAQELGLPIILQSQKAGATLAGDYVFRNALTSQMQVQSLVDTAMGKMGMKRFAILYPNDAYGVEFANLFWDEVRARNGDIRGAQTYDPQETDFRGHVQRLVGTYYFEDRANEYRLYSRAWAEKNPKRSARQAPPTLEELLPPIMDFDAIFIPDTVKAVGQIAPMLAYTNVSGVRLLGTNIWNSPSLISRGQKFVEGAVFVDSYLAGSASFVESAFYRGFKTTFEEEPGLTEVQAYDSGLILRQLIGSGATTRQSVRDRIATLQGLPGAIGALSVTREREILRPLSALTARDGRITSMDSTRRQ
jgi:outer membrane PBP1 activator LpoA protein